MKDIPEIIQETKQFFIDSCIESLQAAGFEIASGVYEPINFNDKPRTYYFLLYNEVAFLITFDIKESIKLQPAMLIPPESHPRNISNGIDRLLNPIELRSIPKLQAKLFQYFGIFFKQKPSEYFKQLYLQLKNPDFQQMGFFEVKKFEQF